MCGVTTFGDDLHAARENGGQFRLFHLKKSGFTCNKNQIRKTILFQVLSFNRVGHVLEASFNVGPDKIETIISRSHRDRIVGIPSRVNPYNNCPVLLQAI